MKRWGIRILGLFVISTFIGLLFASPFWLGDKSAQPWLGIVINWWLWALFSPILFFFDRWLPFTFKQPGKLIAGHLAFATSLTALYVAVAATLEYALGINEWEPWLHLDGLFAWFLWALMVYALLFGALQAKKYYERYVQDELRLERLERRYVEAELSTIRAKLDPHFLFNTLNGISTQVERQPNKARKMIEDLAELLRMSLDASNRHDVSLGQEVSLLNRYVDIQKMRFADRLKVEISIPDDVRFALVPSLLLQPLVENAINHGVSSRVAGGSIVVQAEVQGGVLVIDVLDDGVGLPVGWVMGNASGMGLLATQTRVQNFCDGEISHMDVHRRETGGTAVQIRLPLKFAGKAEHDVSG